MIMCVIFFEHLWNVNWIGIAKTYSIFWTISIFINVRVSGIFLYLCRIFTIIFSYLMKLQTFMLQINGHKLTLCLKALDKGWQLCQWISNSWWFLYCCIYGWSRLHFLVKFFNQQMVTFCNIICLITDWKLITIAVFFISYTALAIIGLLSFM